MLSNDVLIVRSIYNRACLKILRKLICNALKLKCLNSLQKNQTVGQIFWQGHPKPQRFSFLGLTCICQNGPDSVKFCHLSWAPVMLFGLSNKLILYGDHYQTPCSMKFYRKSYDEKNIQTIQKTSWGWPVLSSSWGKLRQHHLAS